MRLLGTLLTKKPVVVVLVFMLAAILLVAGAAKMKMATGNETLLSTDTKVYKDNLELEKHFGGESIILLNKSSEDKAILTVENFARMKNLENSLKQYDEIYSFISPANIVEQLTAKQADKMLGNMTDIQKGLAEMGGKLVEIGTSVEQKAAGFSLPDTSGLMQNVQNLNTAFDKMTTAQGKLSTGIGQLNGGYREFAGNLGDVADKVSLLGVQLAKVEQTQSAENKAAVQTLKQSKAMAEQLAAKLKVMADKMNQVSTDSQPLTKIPEQTVAGLTEMQKGLNKQTGQLDGMSNAQELPGELTELASGLKNMGDKLLEISDGLNTLFSYSDIMQPGLPTNPDTLYTLLYDQDELRPVFRELILDDRNSLMMIKLNGNTDDKMKEQIIDTIKEQLERDPFTGVETIVTGKPVIDAAVRASMQDSMKKMIGIAIVIMMIVLSLVFPVRWRILAIPVILLAVVATLGLMGHVSVPMTMVSMAVFPILIGLGVDYAIQFQNRYEEECAKEESLHA